MLANSLRKAEERDLWTIFTSDHIWKQILNKILKIKFSNVKKKKKEYNMTKLGLFKEYKDGLPLENLLILLKKSHYQLKRC